MKRITAAALFVLLFGATAAFGENSFGIGIIGGQPVGVTARLWLGQKASIDGAVAWSYLYGGSVYANLNFEYSSFHGSGYTPGELGFFAGIGGRLLFADSVHVGARIPFGLMFPLTNVSLEFFLELAPVLEFLPLTELSGDAMLGVRYHF